VPPLPVRPRYQPAPQPTIAINTGVPSCCEYRCGRLVPLSPDESYNDPLGDGKNLVTFNVAISPWCGIPVARVLLGDLEGLVNCDDFVTLNPRSSSVRLRIKVRHPSTAWYYHELTLVESGQVTRSIWPRSAYKRSTVALPSPDLLQPTQVNTPVEKFKVEDLARKVCAQIEKFIVSP